LNRGAARRRLQPLRAGGKLPSALCAGFLHQPPQNLLGDAIQFDRPTSQPVRDFFIENAEYWIEEFHLDGLRLDAVHAIKDDARLCFLDELATRLRSRYSRPIHLLLENESNDPRRLARHGGKPDLYTAQWNDDIHHVLRVAATHEMSGYYAAQTLASP
jgi:1,4-alpha-glucan branching enzyme